MSNYEIALDRLQRGMNRVMFTLAGTALVLMAVATVWSILARVLPLPSVFGGSVEFGGYMMLAVVYLGAGGTFVTGGFLRVDLLFHRLPPGGQRILTLLALVIAVIVTFVLLKDVFAETMKLIGDGTRSAGNLQLPRYIPFGGISLGLALLLLQELLLGVKLFFVWRRGASADEIMIDHDAEDDLKMEGVV